MAKPWRYMAQRFDGSGNLGEFVDLNLPLSDVEIDEVLSGDNALSATISPALSRLKGSDGQRIFQKWGTCIWAESPNGEIFGGILESDGLDGPSWAINCVDLSGALAETPYDGAIQWASIDPIDVFRYIWIWYQSRPGCNLSITSDNTTSPVRLGGGEFVVDQSWSAPEELVPVDLAPSAWRGLEEWYNTCAQGLKSKGGWTFDEVRAALVKWVEQGRSTLSDKQKKMVDKAKKKYGKPPKEPADEPVENPAPSIPPNPPLIWQENPHRLNWYTDHDLSSNVETLSASTPFDWHLKHYWSDEDDDALLMHHLRIGYPKLGRRITDLRFVLGENIHEVPSIEGAGDEYASEIIVIGNGEGSAAVVGRAFRPTPGRMRRTKTVVDTTLMSTEACNQRAELEVAARTTIDEISELIITDHPHAPAGSISVGDEFLLEAHTDWVDMSVWVRCVARRITPADDTKMGLSVIRTDRLG